MDHLRISSTPLRIRWTIPLTIHEQYFRFGSNWFSQRGLNTVLQFFIIFFIFPLILFSIEMSIAIKRDRLTRLDLRENGMAS
jgi:hypothetical protein